MREPTDPLHLTLTPTVLSGSGARQTSTCLYLYPLPSSISLKVLANINDTPKHRPKIVRYIASDNSKEVRNARSGR